MRLEDVKFKQKVYILVLAVLPNWLGSSLKYLMNGEDCINLLTAESFLSDTVIFQCLNVSVFKADYPLYEPS